MKMLIFLESRLGKGNSGEKNPKNTEKIKTVQVFLKWNSVWKREKRKTPFQCDPI